MATILSIDTIISDDEVKGGQPIIAGTRIRVSDVVSSHLYRDQSPDELAVNFKLTLGQVYAVLAYYYQNKSEIDTLIRQDSERIESYLRKLDDDGKLIRSK